MKLMELMVFEWPLIDPTLLPESHRNTAPKLGKGSGKGRCEEEGGKVRAMEESPSKKS